MMRVVLACFMVVLFILNLTFLGSAVNADINKWIQDFGNPNPDMRKAAEDAFSDLKGASGIDAIDPLIQALENKDAHVRQSAAVALSNIFLNMKYSLVPKDTRAVEPLIQALNDEDSLVRGFAAVALGESHDARALEPLIKNMNEDSKNRLMAADALRELGEPALDSLIKLLTDGDSGIRSWAAYALGGIGNARAVDPLINSLNDENILVRKDAAWALGRLKDNKAIEPLKQALNDENGDVQKAAKESLKELGWQPSAPQIPPAAVGGTNITLAASPVQSDVEKAIPNQQSGSLVSIFSLPSNFSYPM